jgi:type II secretory pathway component PulF
MAINTKKQVSQQKPKDSIFAFVSNLQLKKSISAQERKFFTAQMALLLETGTSLQASLQALLKQMDNPAMITMVEQLSDDIGQGLQFSQALARHPKVFSPTYVNLVAASEDGGFMHQVLEQLLELDDKREQLRQTLASALSYPIFLMVFALGVVIFVLVVVFPKFADLFSQIQDELPVTTVFLMAASEILKKFWIEALIGLAILFVGFKYWSSTEQGAEKLDWMKLNLPLLRNIFTQLYLVQSLRVLSLSLSNGVGMMDSLQASKFVVDNRIFQQFIGRVEDNVENGNGISAGFRNTSFIPPIVEQMINTGEETGSLPKVLSRLSDYFEAELSGKLRTLSRLAEPIMLLVMGGVVGLIVSSLILPIFKLSRAVG